MVRAEESLESMVTETENAIQEYRQKIQQALEIDSKKLKEKAERDSNQIIARAKEEAEQIIKKAREEAAEAQQESARAIGEAKEKAAQIIAEVIERGTTQAQRELARTASEARSKTSQLLAQVSKGIDQIISDTETNIKAELERLSTVITEAKEKLQPLSEVQNKEPAINLRRSANETVIPLGPATEKPAPAAPPAAEKRAAPVKDNEDTQIFKGSFKIEIVAQYNQERLEGVPDWLYRVPGLKVMSTDVYTRANRWITAYNVELDKPMPLLKVLKAIPQLKDVTEHRGNIVMALR